VMFMMLGKASLVIADIDSTHDLILLKGEHRCLALRVGMLHDMNWKGQCLFVVK
jgi:hypothetical protein